MVAQVWLGILAGVVADRSSSSMSTCLPGIFLEQAPTAAMRRMWISRKTRLKRHASSDTPPPGEDTPLTAVATTSSDTPPPGEESWQEPPAERPHQGETPSPDEWEIASETASQSIAGDTVASDAENSTMASAADAAFVRQQRLAPQTPVEGTPQRGPSSKHNQEWEVGNFGILRCNWGTRGERERRERMIRQILKSPAKVQVVIALQDPQSRNDWDADDWDADDWSCNRLD